MYVVFFLLIDRLFYYYLLLSLIKPVGSLFFQPFKGCTYFCHDLYHLTNEATVKQKCNF